jgi:ABC-type proline/glycine betaine transport system ATPase subunit
MKNKDIEAAIELADRLKNLNEGQLIQFEGSDHYALSPEDLEGFSYIIEQALEALTRIEQESAQRLEHIEGLEEALEFFDTRKDAGEALLRLTEDKNTSHSLVALTALKAYAAKMEDK